MERGKSMAEFSIVIGMIVIGGVVALVPIVLLVLLLVWLSNKRRRDELMIARLVEIKQAIEDVRDKLKREAENT
jgi:hypothetical protein